MTLIRGKLPPLQEQGARPVVNQSILGQFHHSEPPKTLLRSRTSGAQALMSSWQYMHYLHWLNLPVMRLNTESEHWAYLCSSNGGETQVQALLN